jgi:hypothetical protein
LEACLRVFRAIEDHAKNGAETERAAPPRRARAG